MSAVVLTSENSEAFYAGRLGLPPPEPAAAPAASAEDSAKTAGEPAKESGKEAAPAATEPGTDEQQDSQHPDPEKRQKLNLRFSELSKQRDEAKALAEKHAAEAKAEREARELAEKRAKELEAKVNPPAEKPADPIGPKPQPGQFKDAFEYAEALAEWSTEKALHERDAKEAEARQQAEAEARVSAFKERQEAAKAAIPDYEEVIKASPVVVSAEVREAILESDVGPQVLHYLAKNPDVADKLAKMSVGRAMREFGKLETALAKGDKPAAPSASASPQGAAKPAAAVSEISRAPAPITPLRSSAGAEPAPLIDDKGVFHGTYADWKKARMEGKIK